jgi:hypothetical protein
MDGGSFAIPSFVFEGCGFLFLAGSRLLGSVSRLFGSFRSAFGVSSGFFGLALGVSSMDSGSLRECGSTVSVGFGVFLGSGHS